jgi:hypothetical protein
MASDDLLLKMVLVLLASCGIGAESAAEEVSG